MSKQKMLNSDLSKLDEMIILKNDHIINYYGSSIMEVSNHMNNMIFRNFFLRSYEFKLKLTLKNEIYLIFFPINLRVTMNKF